MSQSPLDPMPQEVQSLLEGLRNREGPSAEAKALVRARLERTLSLEWAPTAAPSPVASRAAQRVSMSAGRWMLATAGLVGISGLLWYAGRTPPRAPAPQSPIRIRSMTPLSPASPGMEPTQGAPGAIPTQPEPQAPAVAAMRAPAQVTWVPVPAVPARPARRATPGATNAPAPSPGSAAAPSLSGERRLLDQARNALRNGDADLALAAVEEHARRYPDGQLVEEREVLGIQAMVQSGQTTEARARGQAFLTNFPDSPLHRVVQSTVDSLH